MNEPSTNLPANELPSHTQTVVIGGGIVGCSVAFHLAKAGHQVVLLERKQLTSGCTWHAAGLVSQFHVYPCVTRLAMYGIELMNQLQAETGQATGFARVGATAVALNAARHEELLRRKDIAMAQGIEVRSQTIDELAAQWPLLNTDGILGAIHFPNDGQTNPIDTTMALAKGARMAGAQIFECTEVRQIIVEQGRACGVATERGDIHAENIVNCTGIWGRDFANRNGSHLPIQHNQHFYIVSDPIEELCHPTPVLRVYDEQAYYKEDAGKLLIGFAELNGMPWDPEGGIPDSFEFTELPCPEDHLMPVLEKCIERVPVLGEVGIRTFFNGPEGYTPDGRYFLGEDPNINKLFVGAGFNSSGIQNGPGAGMVLAEWIIKGYAPRDLVDVDIRRLHSFQANRDYLLARGPETLSETYAMHWPYKQRKSVRGLRRSPVHEQLKAAGAVFGDAAGWERPMWFAPEGVTAEYEYGYNRTPWFEYWQQEHQQVRNDLGLTDLSPFSKLLIEGDQAEAFMQQICSNDVSVAPGRVVYTQWLNDRAGIEADVTVARISESSYLVMTAAATGPAELTWLRKQQRNNTNFSSIHISDISNAQAAFGLSGPRAREFLSAYTRTDLSNEAFPFGTSKNLEVGPVSVRAQRISYTGELGWELFVESSFAAYLFELFMSGEKAHPPRLIGLHAGESLRTEKAYRHWGHDIGYTDSPLESGLMFASKLDKAGGFIGADALRLAHEQSRKVLKNSTLQTTQSKPTQVRRQILQFLLQDTERFIYHNEPIYLDDEIVGTITTGTYGHTLGGPVGLGWVSLPATMKIDEIEAQPFEVLVAGVRVSAKASAKPMYDPSSSRVRA